MCVWVWISLFNNLYFIQEQLTYIETDLRSQIIDLHKNTLKNFVKPSVTLENFFWLRRHCGLCDLHHDFSLFSTLVPSIYGFDFRGNPTYFSLRRALTPVLIFRSESFVGDVFRSIFRTARSEKFAFSLWRVGERCLILPSLGVCFFFRTGVMDGNVVFPRGGRDNRSIYRMWMCTANDCSLDVDGRH